jgi:predicted ATP-grasp superfamily ATP-dependent carboligase
LARSRTADNLAVATLETTPRVPVLIFGPHLAALGVLRLLGERGVQGYGVEATSNIIVRSRWYRAAERTLRETADSDELAEFLQSFHLPRAVLVPCTDIWTLAVAGLPVETRQRFPASVAPRQAVEQVVDKDRFRALLDRLGIPYPRTLTLQGPADLDLATDSDLANGFLKPTDSQRHNRLFGKKGFFVHSRLEAARLVEKASAAGITFMLQDWIPGNMSKTILIDGFVDRHGTIATMVARRRLRMDPPKLANTVSAVTIPLAEVSEATSALTRLLADIEYRGIFNVEFKFDERDRQFKIIDVNPRPAWFMSPIARAGVDLPWMSYLDAQELPVPAPSPYQVGRYGLYEIRDGAAIVRALATFRRPEGPVLVPWLRGDRTLFWWSDPLPAFGDVWRILRQRTIDALGFFSRAARRPR